MSMVLVEYMIDTQIKHEMRWRAVTEEVKWGGYDEILLEGIKKHGYGIKRTYFRYNRNIGNFTIRSYLKRMQCRSIYRWMPIVHRVSKIEKLSTLMNELSEDIERILGKQYYRWNDSREVKVPQNFCSKPQLLLLKLKNGTYRFHQCYCCDSKPSEKRCPNLYNDDTGDNELYYGNVAYWLSFQSLIY